ncbi:G8 domain-containing protein [Marinicella litoralis]|uniref:G8 domain-containing protein n=1 Tax=Marinicella litoralis TaxID=644220 RepID=A0A4R6XXW1_9GAMM|nr:G8 domain-containing protein [Marinicella litoralis]TDR22543.1 G8 domain-containing protein [Marinicella litoralis]
MKTAQLFCCLLSIYFTPALAINHSKQIEAIQGLIDNEDITHTAITDGLWFDTATWAGGEIPNENAWVLIPAGIDIEYDQINTTALAAIRVEGGLKFSTTQSSRLIVETLLIESTGRLIIGSKNKPILADVTVAIEIRDTGDLDVVKDPTLMGRGLLARGPVNIHGAKKTPHLKVSTDPLAGHNQLILEHTPHNWQTGDTLVLAGTKYSGWKWDNDIQAVRYHGTQDEVLTIANIDANVVTLNESLQYDHFTPRSDLKTSVANMSRNVTIATQDPDNTATHRRGHVMFMQTAEVDVRYASFWQLGRTDKSFLTLEASDFDPITPTSNVRGRYAFHLHRKGITNAPVIAIGNAVMGSPGWGYVHHDSNAFFHNNVSFDTFGAGFVAETGNEVGSWTQNLAIKAEGNSAFNPKNGNDRDLFDIGRTGDGFWFQGRMVRSVNNIAASVNHGFVYLHRGSGMLSFPGSVFMLPEALRRAGNSAVDDAPILSFEGNESFASTVGLYVVKANPNQEHDVHSHFKDFTAWEVRAGSAMEYTSHYVLENFDIIGNTPEPFRTAAFGIEFGTNTSDMVVNGAHIEDMAVGVILSKNYTDPAPPPETNQYVLIDTTYTNVGLPMEFYDPTIDQILTTADLVAGQFDITINAGVYEYLSPATSAGSGLFWLGEKIDSIGFSPIPAGTDVIGVPAFDMIATLEEDGYFRTAGGTPYAVVEEYFTDRSTGTIHKLGLKTLLGPAVDNVLGDPFSAWRDAFQVGIIDLNSLPPVTQDDNFQVSSERLSLLNLLVNDSDPENNPLSIDGIVQPKHGRVFPMQNGGLNGHVSYVSDYDYIGPDQFSYWATDQNGNYTPAQVHINVVDDLIYTNDFAE